MKHEDAFLNDTHISKVHQLNRISDLKCFSCELGSVFLLNLRPIFPVFSANQEDLSNSI